MNATDRSNLAGFLLIGSIVSLLLGWPAPITIVGFVLTTIVGATVPTARNPRSSGYPTPWIVNRIEGQKKGK